MQTAPEHDTERKGITRRFGRIFLSVGRVRAGAEAVILSLLMTAWVSLMSDYQGGNLLIQELVIGPLCAILFALRTRLDSGDWRDISLREAVAGAVAMALVTAPGIALYFIGEATVTSLVASALLFVWNFGAFVVFRIIAYLWPRWTHLRRSRLRWEMTHATLVVVAAVSAALMVAAVLFLILRGVAPESPFLPAGQAAPLLPFVGILIFFTVIGLAVILPPAAVVSYFVARRTALRLEALAHGTNGLREGNLDIRVEVDGSDEVSDLQRDFNAMADDLGRTLRELRSERDNVEQLLKTQRELVANVSHELRTPVSTMRGYLESALGDRNGNIPEDLRNDLEVMEHETIRLQRLIDDLFVLTRTEAGKLPLEIRPTDVNVLISRCHEAVGASAWQTGKVEVVISPSPPVPAALADEGRLEQSVRNLLSNAIRHTPPGGVIALGASLDGDSVVVEVKDTGEGIPADELEHVFDRFYRSDGARNLDHSGAGLGLTLVRELTEAMDGSVAAESEPGEGSRFTLRLPRA